MESLIFVLGQIALFLVLLIAVALLIAIVVAIALGVIGSILQARDKRKKIQTEQSERY